MLESYHFTFLLVVVVSLYFVSSGLVKYNKITLFFHRKVWNYLLLFSFLVSGFMGLILALLIDYKISISWYSNFLWLHVESGIVMAVISFFHLLWHKQYYLSGSANKNKKTLN